MSHAMGWDSGIDDVFDGMAFTEEQTKPVIKAMLDCLDLFDKKQRDYGSANIAVFGDPGILTRMFDKLHRLKNLYDRNGDPAVDESIEDTIVDICNYAAMMLVCRRGRWKGFTPKGKADTKPAPISDLRSVSFPPRVRPDTTLRPEPTDRVAPRPRKDSLMAEER
uniref:Nucleotide modification associated domain-containing protein n=1 Tax=viral metagenome TaxID=1070528 RepID=A0A6M3JKM2_9ZZZZ